MDQLPRWEMGTNWCAQCDGPPGIVLRRILRPKSAQVKMCHNPSVMLNHGCTGRCMGEYGDVWEGVWEVWGYLGRSGVSAGWGEWQCQAMQLPSLACSEPARRKHGVIKAQHTGWLPCRVQKPMRKKHSLHSNKAGVGTSFWEWDFSERHSVSLSSIGSTLYSELHRGTCSCSHWGVCTLTILKGIRTRTALINQSMFRSVTF